MRAARFVAGPAAAPTRHRSIGPTNIMERCYRSRIRQSTVDIGYSEKFLGTCEPRATTAPGRRRTRPGDVRGTSLGPGPVGGGARARANRSGVLGAVPVVRSWETTRSRVGAIGR